MKLKPLIVALCSVVLLAAPANADEPKSPIFGNASAMVTSVNKNKSIVGKGYYSDYYGYYGVLYSSYAQYYGNIAYYSSSSSTKYYYYYYASSYAYTAYSNFSSASYWAYYGY